MINNPWILSRQYSGSWIRRRLSLEKKKRGLKCRIPLEAAVFTAALSCLLFGLFGFWPFGKGSVIVEDLFSQYTPLLYHFFDCVTGKENLFGDIRIAGGLNLYADTINEILNPFNYVLLLFGRENIYLSVNLLLLLYMTAASASAALFLKETFPDSDPVILSLSCAYGLSGYVFYNYQIIKWEYLVVLLPLFLIALRRMEKKGRGALYSVLLAYQIALSIQLGFETCLFVFFGYGFYLHILVPQQEKKERFRRLVFYSLLGVALSAAVLIPNICTLLTSARSGYTASYIGVMQQHGLDDLFERIFNIFHPAVFALMLCLLPGRIGHSRRRGRKSAKTSGSVRRQRKTWEAETAAYTAAAEKTAAENALDTTAADNGIMDAGPMTAGGNKEVRFYRAWVLFLFLTVLLQPANLIWHLGSYRCFPVRYAYMVLLSAECLCAALYREKSAHGSRDAGAHGQIRKGLFCIFGTALLLAGIALSVRWQERISNAFSTLAISLTCRTETCMVAGILALLTAGSFLITNGAFPFLSASCGKKRLLSASCGKKRLLSASCGKKRFLSGSRGKKVFAVLLTIPALASGLCYGLFFFLPESNQVRQMNEEAYEELSGWNKDAVKSGREEGPLYTGSRIFMRTDAKGNMPRDFALVSRASTLTAYLPTLSDRTQRFLQNFGYYTYWVATDETGGTVISDFVLNEPLLFKASAGDLAISEDSAVTRQQKLSQILTGQEDAAEVIEGSEVSFDGEYEIHTDGKKHLYLETETPSEDFTVFVNGEKLSYDGDSAAEAPSVLIDLGIFEDSDVTVRIRGDGGAAPSEDNVSFLAVDESIWKKAFEEILYGENAEDGANARVLSDAEISDDESRSLLNIRIDDAGDGDTVVLPIVETYGYHVTLNGKTVKPAEVLGGLMGIRTEKGLNTIRIVFIPDGLNAGILVSAAALTVLIVLCVRRRKKKNAAVKSGRGEKDPGEILWLFGILVVYVIPCIGLVFFMGHKALSQATQNGSSVTSQTQDVTVLDTESTEDGVRVDIAGENLMLLPGVRISADSTENNKLLAKYVNDGIRDDDTLRWSSENDREKCDHYVEAKFRETETFGVVRIYWERCNASKYAIEVSDDGKTWQTAASFDTPPVSKEDEIRFDTPVTGRYLRLHVTDVLRNEADATLYYQNVSVLEMEVYSGVEDSFVVRNPEVSAGTERILETPSVPDGYRLEFAGADLESIIDSRGRIADTIADVEVEVGYRLISGSVATDLPGMKITIPASAAAGENAAAEEGAEEADEKTTLPDGVSVREWRPSGGGFVLSDAVKLVLPSSQSGDLSGNADIFAEELKEAGFTVERASALPEENPEEQESKVSLIALQLADEDGTTPFECFASVSGEEGYSIDLASDGKGIYLTAGSVQGLRWAEITLEKILQGAGDGNIPAGCIRDYPRYSVRGFGIDVGRREISLDFLKKLVIALSGAKMNELQVHLNDNETIAQSGYDGTVEGALSLQSGFRLASDIRNKDGESITSEDFFYTKEEFADFISWAADYGVRIVPEIDTPAHSLAFTKVFPELILGDEAGSADELDLSDPEAAELGKEIWTEYVGDGKTFADAKTVGIGMDEYYGSGSDYVDYFNTIANTVSGLDPDITVRAWGSFDWYGADPQSVSTDVQMQVWQFVWQNPEELYEDGFSVINSMSSHLYIIPGGGYDRLDMDYLKDTWEPNVFEQDGTVITIPAYSSRMPGAVYMMWNEKTGTDISEDGLYERFSEPLGVLSGKLW